MILISIKPIDTSVYCTLVWNRRHFAISVSSDNAFKFGP